MAAKEKTKLAKKQGQMSEKELAEVNAKDAREKAELDLLIDDGSHKDKLLELKSAKRDSRFVRDGDNDFAVDPTHKEFHKVGA